jgi:hypothetical protein
MTEPAAAAFRAWLMTHAVAKATVEGDVIREARADPSFPEIGGWDDLERYLRRRRASFEEVEAAKELWARWQAYRKRSAP